MHQLKLAGVSYILTDFLSRHLTTHTLYQRSRSNTQDRAVCLLIDFDNSIDLDAANEDKENQLAQRTVCSHILKSDGGD